jgi:hypothetical protein
MDSLESDARFRKVDIGVSRLRASMVKLGSVRGDVDGADIRGATALSVPRSCADIYEESLMDSFLGVEVSRGKAKGE